jgi:hypothetical protein
MASAVADAEGGSVDCEMEFEIAVAEGRAVDRAETDGIDQSGLIVDYLRHNKPYKMNQSGIVIADGTCRP